MRLAPSNNRLPEYMFLLVMSGNPSLVYFGVACVPSRASKAFPNRVHSQPSGRGSNVFSLGLGSTETRLMVLCLIRRSLISSMRRTTPLPVRRYDLGGRVCLERPTSGSAPAASQPRPALPPERQTARRRDRIHDADLSRAVLNSFLSRSRVC